MKSILGDWPARIRSMGLLVLDGEAQANFLAIDFDNGGGAPFLKHAAKDA
jgi:hypothetical protein